MNKGFKRKLLAGLFAPVLALSIGTALAQTSPGTTGTGTGAAGGTSGTQGATGPTTGTGTGSAMGAGGTSQTGAGAAGTSATGSTGATTGAPGGSNMSASWDAATFSRLDKNGDGMLSREEAQADPTVGGAWSRLDTTNRGSVSRDDFERYGKTQGSANRSPSSSGTGTPK